MCHMALRMALRQPVPDRDETVQLERFLTRASAKLPAADLLAETGLAGYAAAQAAQVDIPSGLSRACIAAAARHATIRAELARLLSAWSRAGIEALVFKGFHLAEFVYPNPGARRYSDVDILIRPLDGLEAAKIAVEIGWEELWHAARPATPHGPRGPGYDGHEIMQLRHRRIGVRLDVHRRLVHNNHNRSGEFRRQQRITDLAWLASQWVDLEDASVRQLQPLDAILVGLVLNRCWSPEDWELRPHDYLDFRLIVEKFGVERQALLARARELECPRTLRVFLQRCDPYQRRLRLGRPGALERQRWNLRVAPERGNRYLERWFLEFGLLLRMPVEILRELPGAVWVRVITAGHGPVASRTRELLMTSGSYPEGFHGLAKCRPGRLGPAEWRAIKRGVHRSLRLLGRRGPHAREVEAVALCHALRRRSYPAVLRRGEGTDGDGGGADLWIELDGKALNLGGTLLAD
jgi:hypothetical protein